MEENQALEEAKTQSLRLPNPNSSPSQTTKAQEEEEGEHYIRILCSGTGKKWSVSRWVVQGAGMEGSKLP